MLLVDDDQAEAGQGREDSRARPDADPGGAAAKALPLIAALAGREPGMEDGDALAEASPEPADGLRRQPDLGDEDDDAPAPLDGRLGGGQVDLGLARAGDAVQEQLGAIPVKGVDDPLDRRCLLCVELGPAGGTDRDFDRSARDFDLSGLDQVAFLETANRRPGGASVLAESRRACLASALGECLEHSELLGAQPGVGRLWLLVGGAT